MRRWRVAMVANCQCAALMTTTTTTTTMRTMLICCTQQSAITQPRSPHNYHRHRHRANDRYHDNDDARYRSSFAAVKEEKAYR